MREILKKGNDGLIEITECYLKYGSLAQTGKHFGINGNTVRKKIELIKDIDTELYLQAIAKIESKKTVRRNEYKPIDNNTFKTLGKSIKKRALIDWYAKSNNCQDISIKDLICLVERNGTKVIN